MTLPAALAEAFPALGGLMPESRARMAAALIPSASRDGTRLFSPGQACTHFLFVTHGTVRVGLVTGNGHEMTLYRVAPGETCVMTTSCLFGDAGYAADGTVEGQLEGFSLPKAAFDRLLAADPAFRGFIFAAFGARLADLMRAIEAAAFGRVAPLLARALLGHASRLGGTDLVLTHAALARDLGTAREVVSRQLGAFARQGLVRLARGRIALTDAAALRSIAADSGVR